MRTRSAQESRADHAPREEARAAFLAACGLAERAIRPLAGDASFRRYYRIPANGGQALVLMDAPPPYEDVRPFLAVAGLLEDWGLHPPQVIAADVANGFVLLEDLGDGLFARLIARDPVREPALYQAAVDVLGEIALRSKAPARRLPIPHAEGDHWSLREYDAEPLWMELDLFVDWYLPLIDRPADDAARAAFHELWAPLVAEMAAGARVLTLRDYHADNLIWCPQEAGLRRVGLLDFQDALLGHPAYDLVSLLQDARRDVPPGLEQALRTHFLDTLQARRLWPRGGAARREFARFYALFGVQRATKIIGIFARLWLRDGKSRYLAMIPRVWGLLERSLAALGDERLKAWYARAVPAPLRALVPAARPAAEVLAR